MKLRLGFDERASAGYVDGEACVLNAETMLSVPRDQIASEVTRRLESMMTSTVPRPGAIVTSFQPVFDDVADSLMRGHRIGYNGHAALRDVIEAWSIWALSAQLDKEEWMVPRTALDLGGDWLSLPAPVLRGRFGNVELRVIDNWLVDPGALLSMQSRVMDRLDDDAYMNGPRTNGSGQWLSSDDMEFNLRQLITLAGYYPDLAFPEASLEAWCKEYLHSIRSSASLYAYPGALPNFLFIQEHLADDRGLIDFALFPPVERFYQFLAGRNIIMVTPFADEIQAKHSSGESFDLFTDMQVPAYSLTTVQAPMSIYPLRPGRSWTASFEETCRLIDGVMNGGSADLFLASAGCYGMPLCNYANARYGIETHYYGNFIHAFFGIEQSGTKTFMAGRRKGENWSESPVKHLPNVARADGGRYV